MLICFDRHLGSRVHEQTGATEHAERLVPYGIHAHRNMPTVHLISTGCQECHNVLQYVPQRLPNSKLVFARLDLDRLEDEPRQGGRYLHSWHADGSPSNGRAHKMQAMYEYASERWVPPIRTKIIQVLRTSASEHGADVVFVIVACKAGHHRSVATVECLSDDMRGTYVVYVWHWSYICESNMLDRALGNLGWFLETAFPHNFWAWHEELIEESVNLKPWHGTIISVNNSTRHGHRLKAWGNIGYIGHDGGANRIHWHTDEIVNWDRFAYTEPEDILESLRGMLVQFCEGAERRGNVATRIHLFPHSLSSHELVKNRCYRAL